MGLVNVAAHSNSKLQSSDARMRAALSAAVEGVEQSSSEATRAAYDSDARAFQRACRELGLPATMPMSVETLAAWLGDMKAQGLKLSTIKRRRAWVSKMHADADSNPAKAPVIVKMLKGWGREGAKPEGKRAITPSMIRAAWGSLSTRERAMASVAIVTGLRASELVALCWGNVEPHDAGRVVLVPRSKTDQQGQGRHVAIPRNEAGGDVCPVRALEAHRLESDENGRIFTVSTKTVERLAKKIAKLSGEPASEFAAHSFRAGMLTAASKAGVGLAEIMEQSGHKSMNVALAYVRAESIMKNRAAAAVASAL